MSNNQKAAPAKEAQGNGQKGSCWREEEGVTFLPVPKFKRVLRTLLLALHG
jgi:hypothetical protein